LGTPSRDSRECCGQAADPRLPGASSPSSTLAALSSTFCEGELTLVTDESETPTITSRAMLPPASCFFSETQDVSETNKTDAATMEQKLQQQQHLLKHKWQHELQL
jgi:hypothetical protein